MRGERRRGGLTENAAMSYTCFGGIGESFWEGERRDLHHLFRGASRHGFGNELLVVSL